MHSLCIDTGSICASHVHVGPTPRSAPGCHAIITGSDPASTRWLPIAELIRYQASEFYKKNGGIGYLFNADELLLGRVDRIHKQTAFTNKKDAQQKCLSMNHRLFLQVKYSNQALMKGDSSPQLDKMTV